MKPNSAIFLLETVLGLPAENGWRLGSSDSLCLAVKPNCAIYVLETVSRLPGKDLVFVGVQCDLLIVRLERAGEPGLAKEIRHLLVHGIGVALVRDLGGEVSRPPRMPCPQLGEHLRAAISLHHLPPQPTRFGFHLHSWGAADRNAGSHHKTECREADQGQTDSDMKRAASEATQLES